MNSIITRGLGVDQLLITQGYGFSVTIVGPTGNEYQFGGVGYAKKFDPQYLKDIINSVIETEKILLKQDEVTVTVELKFMIPMPTVYATLDSIEYKEKVIKVKVTN